MTEEGYGVQDEGGDVGSFTPQDQADEAIPQQEEAQSSPSFYDVDEVPEELRDVYDRMQAGYTQARQKDREQLNTIRKELEQFQGLMTDPQKLKAYLGALEAQGGVMPSGEGEPGIPAGLSDHPGANYRDVIEEAFIDPIDYMIQERIEARVSQLMPELNQRFAPVEAIQQERMRAEWTQLASKYPVLRNLEEEPKKVEKIQAMMQAGASMEEAALAVAGKEILAHQKRSLLKQEPAARRAAGAAPMSPNGAPMRGTSNGQGGRTRLLEIIKEARSRGM
jgi:uncharacterized protein YoaH (UPF0181 family)